MNKAWQLNTRVGSIDLRVPQTRDGEFYPWYIRAVSTERAGGDNGVIRCICKWSINAEDEEDNRSIIGEGISSSSISRYEDGLAPVYSMESKATEKLAVVN